MESPQERHRQAKGRDISKYVEGAHDHAHEVDLNAGRIFYRRIPCGADW